MTTVAVTVSSGSPTKKIKADIDCEQCGLVKSKYTCPKCGFRTCSLPCVKLHKESANCDGQRKQFESVVKASQYNDQVSVKDQEFLQGVTDGLVAGVKRARDVIQQNTVQKVEDKKEDVQKIEKNKDDVQKIGKLEDQKNKNSIRIEEDFEENNHGLEIIDEDEKEESVEENGQSQLQMEVDQKLSGNNNDDDGFQSRDLNFKSNQEVNETIETQAVEESEFLKKYASNEGSKFIQSLTRIEHNLIGSVTRRRIFITIESPSDADGSFFEHFSDTVFWTMDLTFMREIRSGNAPVTSDGDFVLDSEGEETKQVDGYTVSAGSTIDLYCQKARSIPESIKVSTLVKQYISPKIYGIIVSKKDLDEEKMKPFWEAGLEQVNVYMKVPEGDNERYYLVDKEKSILNNLRNRYVHGHPKFIVTLPGDFKYWQPLSEMEAQELHEIRRQKTRERHQNDGKRDYGNRHMRGNRRGNDRGGFRGRGRGGNNFHPYQNDRRGGFSGRGRGGRYNKNQTLDLEEIFSPTTDYRVDRPTFSGRGINDGDCALSGWANAVKRRYNPE